MSGSIARGARVGLPPSGDIVATMIIRNRLKADVRTKWQIVYQEYERTFELKRNEAVKVRGGASLVNALTGLEKTDQSKLSLFNIAK